MALVSATLITRIGGFALIAIIARLANSQVLGVYAAAIAYHGLMTAAGAMGAQSYLVREVARRPNRTWEMLWHFQFLGFAAVSILAIGLGVIIPILPVSDELSSCLYIVLPAVYPGVANILFQAVHVGRQRTAIVTYTALVSAAVNLAAGTCLLILGWNVVWLVGVYMVGQFAVTAVYMIHALAIIRPVQWRLRWSTIKHYAFDIRVFTALSIVAAVFASPELILLSLLQNEAAVGIYAAALKVVNLWWFLPSMFMSSVYPVLARSYYETDGRDRLIVATSLKYVLLFSLPLAAGMSVTAGAIIQLLFGPEFASSTDVLRIVSWILPAGAVCAVLWRVLAAQDRQVKDLHAQLIAVAVRVVAGVILITTLATMGAGLAAVIGVMTSALLYYRFSVRGRVRSQIVGTLVRIGAATAMMAISAAWLDTICPLWIVVAGAAVVYAVGVLLSGALSKRDFAMLRAVIRRQKPGMDARGSRTIEAGASE